MALFNFFRVPRPQRYNYIPRYYDPVKEELEARLGRNQPDGDEDNIEQMKSRISHNFRRKQSVDNRYRRQQTRKSNIRLFVIVIMLLFLTYLVLVELLPTFIAYME